MLGITRVVAIDDDKKDLDALVNGLGSAGAACLGVHYTADPDKMGIVACPHVRVILTDLNLLGLPSPPEEQMFGIIASLLDGLKPEGPYLLALWTRLTSHSDNLRTFLDGRSYGAAKPFAIVPLDKNKYIQGSSVNLNGLVQRFKSFVDDYPALAALNDWEEQVCAGASKTISSIATLGDPFKRGADQQNDTSRLVSAMAKEAVGVANLLTTPHGRAVNEALLPILNDRITASLVRDRASSEIWSKAVEQVQGQHICKREAAQLNRAIHIDSEAGGDRGAERGSVIPLKKVFSEVDFVAMFGQDGEQTATKQFHCKNFATGDAGFTWVLIQAQAACDYAQQQPGPLPFYLGMETKQENINPGRPPGAVWTSPSFTVCDEIRLLRVNTRFHLSLIRQKAQQVQPIYRLREQLLGDLIYHAHTYGARPGHISFRGKD